MNYIGSKKKLFDFLKETFFTYCEINKDTTVFADLFGGTGIVSYGMKQYVKKNIFNDLEFYSYILGKVLIEEKEKKHINVKPIEIDGYITNEYATTRKYFTEKNARLIDGARSQIKSDDWYSLFCLLEASDRVANTASVYGAYLKEYKKSAIKDFKLLDIDYIPSINDNEVYNEDVLSLIRRIKGNILYLDPPYNERQYGSNYHLLNTIAKYQDVSPQGITGLPKEYNKSIFCKKGKAEEALEYLISSADFENIFLSYNDEGIIPIETIKGIFSKYGKYSIEQKIYKRFKADSSRDNKKDSTIEYVHILKK